MSLWWYTLIGKSAYLACTEPCFQPPVLPKLSTVAHAYSLSTQGEEAGVLERNQVQLEQLTAELRDFIFK